MKVLIYSLCLSVVSLCLLACDGTAVDPPTPDPATAEDLSGIYIGEAEVHIVETQWWGSDPAIEVVHLDTVITETITVTAIDVEDSTFHIDKASNFFTSYYELDGEKTFHDQYSQAITYEYDKEWQTSIRFLPEADSVYAYMLVRDIFDNYEEDSTGNVIYRYLVKREYSVRAGR